MMNMCMKRFVRSGDNLMCQQEIKSRQQIQHNLNGDEIKKFYEDILQLPPENTTKTSNFTQEPRKTRQNSQNSPKIEFTVNSFHKASQIGDVESLKKFINQGCNINIKDMFGWTAIMCAVASGCEKSVEFLIQHGADLSVKDNSGKTVLEIAEKSRYPKMINVLKQPRRNDTKLRFRFFEEKRRQKAFYCENCNQNFTETSKCAHLTSTIHQLSTKSASSMTSYHIPDHNVGFQLMLKDGWDREKGLGPSGDGMKYPVKTVLKRDRKGLGVKTNQKARVTHFEPGDQKAVGGIRIRETRSTRRKREQRREMREKFREMKFRKMLNE